MCNVLCIISQFLLTRIMTTVNNSKTRAVGFNKCSVNIFTLFAHKRCIKLLLTRSTGKYFTYAQLLYQFFRKSFLIQNVFNFRYDVDTGSVSLNTFETLSKNQKELYSCKTYPFAYRRTGRLFLATPSQGSPCSVSLGPRNG